MTISDDTLNVDVFNTIRTLLISASPKVTNTTTLATKTATVLSSYNDESVSVPQIIINPIKIDESEWKFGSFQGKKIINVEIECYYEKSVGVEQLSDIVSKTIKEATITGLDLIAVTSDYAFISPNDNKFHLKTLTFTFVRE